MQQFCPIFTALLAMAVHTGVAHAAHRGPMDHGGKDLVLLNGDVVWGRHTNVRELRVLPDTFARVAPYLPSSPGSGQFEVFAERIVIEGTLSAQGAGYTGGGGWGQSKWGSPRYNPWGEPGRADGPFAQVDGPGGYAVEGANGDISTDFTLRMGSGGGGTTVPPEIDLSTTAHDTGEKICFPVMCGAKGPDGAPGGGSGGGIIRLHAEQSITINGVVNAQGTGGQPGKIGQDGRQINCWECTQWGPSAPGDGGDAGFEDYHTAGYSGAGGGLLLFCPGTITGSGLVTTEAAKAEYENGGTVKVFHGASPVELEIRGGRIFTRDIADGWMGWMFF